MVLEASVQECNKLLARWGESVLGLSNSLGIVLPDRFLSEG